MKKLLFIVAAIITFASCSKQRVEPPVTVTKTVEISKAPIQMDSLNQEQLSKVIGTDNAAKHFARINEAAKGKPQHAQAAVAVWFNTLTQSTSQSGSSITYTINNLPANPAFVGIHFSPALQGDGVTIDLYAPGAIHPSWYYVQNPTNQYIYNGAVAGAIIYSMAWCSVTSSGDIYVSATQTTNPS